MEEIPQKLLLSLLRLVLQLVTVLHPGQHLLEGDVDLLHLLDEDKPNKEVEQLLRVIIEPRAHRAQGREQEAGTGRQHAARSTASGVVGGRNRGR